LVVLIKASLAISCLIWAASASSVAQDLPAGTRSVDDPSRQDVTAQQVRDAENDLEQQNYPAAEVKLKALAMARPPDAHVLYDLGFAEERNHEEPEAAKAYAAAIAAKPDLAEARVALGLLDARAGRTDAAHGELRAAANLSAAAPELRGRALRALATLDATSDPAAAQQELAEALQLTPEAPVDTLTAAEMAERAGDAPGAEAAYRRVLAEVPEEPNATAGLAHVLQQQNKLAEAGQVLTAALKGHPDDPRLLAQLANVDAAAGKPEQAVPLLEQARDNNPVLAADAGITRLLARLMGLSGDNAGAAKLYESLLAAEPAGKIDPSLLDALGGAYVRLEHYAEAEAALAKAVSLREEFHDDAAWGDAAAHLAFASSKNGDPQGTLRALAARATVLPNTPVTLFLEATAHDTLHQTKDAERAYRAFLAAADGRYPDQEFQARHRLIALKNMK
jgi:tetratricopeptide (TPR) repeat protein